MRRKKMPRHARSREKELLFSTLRSRGVILRELHALLKAKAPSFGGLVRVMNKRQEFLWVHPQFEGEY